MFLNYGDKSFFENGVLVDVEHSDSVFQILYCRPYDEDDLYLFADCTVDINDDFINEKEVTGFCGARKNINPIGFAIGCIDYYGVENFSSPYNGYQFSRKEIEEQLKHYLIASDNLVITW